jgi:YHS domain-containing protein
MKKTAFLMAAPALLLTLLAFNNFSAGKKKDGSQKAVCTRMTQDCSAAPDTLRKDPICGMMADDTKKDTVHYKNKVYAFCSKHCKEKFVKNPEANLPKPKSN